MKPLQTGITMSLTLIVFYSLCTLIAVVLPEPFTGFMSALFHGMDINKLATTQPYTWASFFYALVLFAVWGLGIGSFFAWIHNMVSGNESVIVERKR